MAATGTLRGDQPDGLAPRAKRIVHGVLLFDKPPGITSNQALQRVKWRYRARKAGHTGSLDPLASGMLPICFGEATKFAGYLLAADKIYRVRARFGTRTDTGDAEGRAVESGSPAVSPVDLAQVLERFLGEHDQTPPMYSALKHEGRRLYELARAGQEVSRAPRRVRIAELGVEEADAHQPVLRVRCSKGTYIRTLVEDIAVAAGTVGHVLELRRLAVLPFEEHQMVATEALQDAAQAGEDALDALLLPVDRLLDDFPAVHLTASEARSLQHGNPVAAGPEARLGMLRLYDENGRLIGLGECLSDGRVAPRRLVAQDGA